MLLLVTNKKWHTPFPMTKNHRRWMTLNVTDNQYDRLSSER